jgi:hypothetical protein
MIFYWMLIGGALFGVAAGVVSLRVRAAGIVVGAVITVAYLGFVLAAGLWAARCWDCAATGDDTRGFLFVAGTFFYGLLVVVANFAMWGTVAVGLLRRRRVEGAR